MERKKVRKEGGERGREKEPGREKESEERGPPGELFVG
jgi:hypothetical protein